MAVKSYNSESPVQPDILTGALAAIDSDHQMVHRYGMFTITHYNLAVADEGTVSIGFIIPTGFEIHIKQFGILGDGFPWVFDALVYTTFTESGTYLTPINHHMSTSPPPSQLTANLNPTDLPAEGNYKILFGGGSGLGGTTSAGGFSPSTEYIMHAGSHLIRATNKTGSTNEFSIVFTWYELDLR